MRHTPHAHAFTTIDTSVSDRHAICRRHYIRYHYYNIFFEARRHAVMPFDSLLFENQRCHAMGVHDKIGLGRVGVFFFFAFFFFFFFFAFSSKAIRVERARAAIAPFALKTVNIRQILKPDDMRAAHARHAMLLSRHATRHIIAVARFVVITLITTPCRHDTRAARHARVERHVYYDERADAVIAAATPPRADTHASIRHAPRATHYSRRELAATTLPPRRRATQHGRAMPRLFSFFKDFEDKAPP